MATQINNQEVNVSNYVEDIVGGLFKFTGEAVGAVAGLASDVVVGTAKGIAEVPGAIVDGFQTSSIDFNMFSSDEQKQEEKSQVVEPEKTEVQEKILSKEEYKAQLEAELVRVYEAINADSKEEIQVNISENK